MSEGQKTELEAKARQAGLTVQNYLRLLLGWPLEKQGARKDLAADHRIESNPP